MRLVTEVIISDPWYVTRAHIPETIVAGPEGMLAHLWTTAHQWEKPCYPALSSGAV